MLITNSSISINTQASISIQTNSDAIVSTQNVIDTSNLLEIPTPKLPTKDVVPVASPASIVTLSDTNAVAEPANVYEAPVEIIKTRNTQDKTDTEKNVSKLLTNNLTSIRAKKSIFSVQSLFSQVGALSRETTSYKNEARNFSASASKTADTNALDFSISGGKPAQGVTLRVTTKDGDTIDIQIQRTTRDNNDSLAFSFSVKGKLSTEEQDALEKLANKLGEVADDFFRTGTTQLHGLKDFDKTTLQGFHIDFSKPKVNNLYSTMSYDFSVDDKNNTQHLTAKDADNYSIDITNDLQNILGGTSATAKDSLQAYLKIIRDAMNEHQPLGEDHSNKFSLQFIIDSFTSMIDGEQPEESSTSLTQKAMTAFDTGLPDFNATIKAPVLKKFKNLMLPESMSLNLMQKTEIEYQKDGGKLIKQTNSFEHKSSKIAGILGSDKGDLDTGNFKYKTIDEKQQIVRILDLNEKGINNVITERTSSTNNTEKTYNSFHLVDSNKDQHSERTITQLVDEISPHKSLGESSERTSYFEKLAYVAKSAKNLFLLPTR